MDGVLVNSMPYHIKGWKKALNKFKMFPSKEELYAMEGSSAEKTITYFSKKYLIKLTKKDKEEIYKLKKKLTKESIKIKIFPWIKKILKHLKKKKIKLAVVTGANKQFATDIINKEFKNIFEIIITGEDTKKGKPNPQPYLLALKKLNIKAKEALVIENAPLGIESSKRSKIKTFAIESSLNKKYLKKADKIFINHKKLYEYFKTNN